MTERNTLHQIADLLGVDPEDLDINIAEADDDDTDGNDTEADQVQAAEARLTKSHPHLTPSERRRYAEHETPGIAEFIANQKQQTPPAHSDNAQVRELIEQRKFEREEERRRATAPMPEPYDESDRPAWSNVSGAYLDRQDDLRRQYENHRQEALAKQQERLDEVAARRDRQAEASQAVEDEITALRKRRRREEAESAKKKPKHGHI